MTATKQHILNTLAYFDIFHYPLLKEEMIRFHGSAQETDIFDEALLSLVEDQYVFRLDEFYSLHNDKSLAERRRKGNQLAAEQMKTAVKAAHILSGFPFVKGLAISGSLSKNFCTEKADIDFFIITSANRLWIARTIMHLYKKFTFLTGKQKWFCMNYYVDEACLEIEEKNVFTAVEIATLLPMQGKSSLEHFKQANKWIRAYFPAGAYGTSQVKDIKAGPGRRFVEACFNNGLGNWIDNRLMRITQKRWERKEQKKMKNEHGFTLGMLVDKHYSKPNPEYFQFKVLEKYRAKLSGLPTLVDVSAKAV